MKYKIDSVTNDSGFKPFSLTLTFETREEYENFHNKIMGKITKTRSHQFHSDFFWAGSEGETNNVNGKI